MDVNRMLKKTTCLREGYGWQAGGVPGGPLFSRTQTWVPGASLPRAMLDGWAGNMVAQAAVKVGLVVGCIFLFGVVTGCSLEPKSLRVTKNLVNLQGRRIKTIAILPVESGHSRGTPSGQPESNRRNSEVDSGALLTDMLYSEMRRVRRWTLIPQPRTHAASTGIKEIDGNQARKIGERVNADAVLFGRVSRYRERSGRGWGSEQPASVAFNLFLVDTATGKRIWSARFDETQQALSENLLNVGKFVKRKTRFVRADELAREGVTKAVADLDKALGSG